MKILIKPLAVILVSTLLFGQIKTSQTTVKIAYAGVQIENVDPWVEEELSKKMQTIFEGVTPEQFLPLNKVQDLAQSEINELFSAISDSNFSKSSDTSINIELFVYAIIYISLIILLKKLLINYNLKFYD